MINIIFGPTIVLSFLMCLKFLILYVVRYVNSSTFNYVRTVDGIYIVIGILYVIILLEHGWRLDPILLFAQYLLVIMATIMTFDNLRLRKIAMLKHDKYES